MRQQRLKDATEASARGASDEEGARWSFEARECCPGEMDIEGRKMRIGTDGRRHQDIGEREERATDTAISTDRALHGALLAKRLVTMAAGGLIGLVAIGDLLVMGRMIMLPLRRLSTAVSH